MSTSNQSQPPKHKPQSSKAASLIKVAVKPQPPRLSIEEIRHVIAVIG